MVLVCPAHEAGLEKGAGLWDKAGPDATPVSLC
jgi:hypothetical protein